MCGMAGVYFDISLNELAYTATVSMALSSRWLYRAILCVFVCKFPSKKLQTSDAEYNHKIEYVLDAARLAFS